MKTIILLITIIALSVSCKKKAAVAPSNPVAKTYKEFNIVIEYKQDSLNSFYLLDNAHPAEIKLHMYNKSPNDPTFNITTDEIAHGGTSFGTGWPLPSYTAELYYNKATENLNESFTYYFYLGIALDKVDGSPGRFAATWKSYTFIDGETGKINFNLM